MSAAVGKEVSRKRVPLAHAAAIFLAALAWAYFVRPGPLSLPYFWDEGDVYAPGARWLAQHTFDIRPGHFPDDWSRGHPQLFYVWTAVFFRLFGDGPMCAHALMLPFTALALTATYVLGYERKGVWLGCTAALALGSSPLFMTMGAFLLPEMPLTALTALTLVCVQRAWWWRASFLCVLMVWIKETGIAPALAVSASHVFFAWRSRNWRSPRRALAISLVPCVALAAFFVWQRIGAGYFVFPHHQHLLTDRAFTLANLVTVFPSLFFWDGRVVLSIAALVACVLLWRRKESLPLLDPTAITIAAMFIFNAFFFAKMFWLERYALPAHPGVVVLLLEVTFVASVGARHASPAHRLSGILGEAYRAATFLTVAIAVVTAAAGLLALNKRGDAPEHSFAFADDVQSHQQAIERIAHGSAAVLSTWPLTTEMREPWLGFTASPIMAFHPDALSSHGDHFDAVLIDSSSRQQERLRQLAQERGFHLQWVVDHRSAPRLEFWAP